MTRWVRMSVLGWCAVIAVAGGCSEKGRRMATSARYPHAGMESLSSTSAEHRQAGWAAAERDRKALAEDLDLLFMTDRPTRLTKWHDN